MLFALDEIARLAKVDLLKEDPSLLLASKNLWQLNEVKAHPELHLHKPVPKSKRHNTHSMFSYWITYIIRI